MGIAAALVLFWIVRDARNGIPRPVWTAWSHTIAQWFLLSIALRRARQPSA